MLLVKQLEASVAFYEGIGFVTENIGGHIHVSHGGATLILHPAKRESDVRPYSGTVDGNYFDVFCYTDREGLQQLVELFQTSGIEIVNGGIQRLKHVTVVPALICKKAALFDS
ncbi:hypothetical protein [Paenibacillus silvisoli]|uniref:hypothetical protein n=1 Tax=Paenibacillus silvisoli TaxID=3110539 RepID=UPI00280410F4|nr:hypothetical protein [Paenibacillus silvisoli]